MTSIAMTRFDGPFTRGQKVRIPAGTVVSLAGTHRLAKRAQTVTVYDIREGHAHLLDDGDSVVYLPYIVWRGAGGALATATVTEHLASHNGTTLADCLPPVPVD